MFRKSTVLPIINNVVGYSPSFRCKDARDLMGEVHTSPYKEQFKKFWAEPVPWMDREYGPKPKLGDPIPTRHAATLLVIAKNKYIDPDLVKGGHDNDYKVLIRYRETKKQMAKDEYLLPSNPVHREDNLEEWMPILVDNGLKTRHKDLRHRLCAMRAFMSDCNCMLIPRNGGSIADVQGPPGKMRWHSIIYTQPKMFKHLVGILRMDMEDVLNQMSPFREVVTPTTETFRYVNTSFIVTIDRMPDMQYSNAMVGESLHWVSPMEAIARFNAGIMDMPTPNLLLLSELANSCQTYDQVVNGYNCNSVPISVKPELVRHSQSKVATVLLPGDMSHTQTTEEDRAQKFFRRFTYVKDFPHGLRTVFEERPATDDDDQTLLVQETPALLLDMNLYDQLYTDVEVVPRLGERSQLEQTSLFDPESFTMKPGEEDAQGTIPVDWTSANPFMPKASRDKLYYEDRERNRLAIRDGFVAKAEALKKAEEQAKLLQDAMAEKAALLEETKYNILRTERAAAIEGGSAKLLESSPGEAEPAANGDKPQPPPTA